MRHSWLSLAAAAVLVPASISAQQVLSGTVRDSSGRPLAGAEVYISQRSKPVRTNQNGQFRIDSVFRGDYWLYARKLGHAPARHTVTVPHQSAPRSVALVLPALPVTLEPVAVTEKSGFGTGVGSAPWFNNDVRAWGRLITRDRIEASKAPRISALLRQYISNYPLDVHEAERWLASQGPSPVATALRNPPVCVPAISVNGEFPMYAFDPDALPIEAVEAVEFFRAGVGTPLALQFQTPRGSCGLVRLWLRSNIGV